MPDPDPIAPTTQDALRRVTVVVNPERGELADDLLAALADDPFEVDVRRLADAADLHREVRDAADLGASVIAAVGGDGTQRTAAGALRGSSSSLAVVPGGTVNLLGKVLGIEDVQDAAEAIRSGRTRAFDVGLVDDDPFVMTATTGYDAAVIHDVDDGAKRFGLAGYLGTGIRRLRRDRPRPVTVHVDGRSEFRGRAMSVLIANIAQRGSARFEVAPEAEPDDGRLDVVVLRCATLPGMLRAGAALLRGRAPDPDDVVYFQGRSVEVRWRGPMWSQRDGDDTGRGTTFRYGIDPDRVTLCVGKHPTA